MHKQNNMSAKWLASRVESHYNMHRKNQSTDWILWRSLHEFMADSLRCHDAAISRHTQTIHTRSRRIAMRRALMKDFLFYTPAASGVDWKRIDSLRHVMEKRTASICSQRALLYTQSFQESEGEPYIIRKAKAFAHTPCPYGYLYPAPFPDIR